MYSTILRKKITMESLSRLSIKITGNIMCCADISRRNKTDKKTLFAQWYLSWLYLVFSTHGRLARHGWTSWIKSSIGKCSCYLCCLYWTWIPVSQVFNYQMFLLLKRPESWMNRGLTNKHVTVLKTPLHRRCWNFCCQLH